MATINKNNYVSVNLEDIEEILKIISDMIAKPSKYIMFNNSVELKYKTKEFQKHHHNVKNIEIYDTMNSIASSLKKNELFYDEYFDLGVSDLVLIF